MISFVNFARRASICVGFDLGILHGYFFHQDFWPNLNFPLEYQIKLFLSSTLLIVNPSMSISSLTCIRSTSNTNINKYADNGSPCFVPRSRLK